MTDDLERLAEVVQLFKKAEGDGSSVVVWREAESGMWRWTIRDGEGTLTSSHRRYATSALASSKATILFPGATVKVNDG